VTEERILNSPHYLAVVLTFPAEAGMSKSEELRKFADNCVQLAEAADQGPGKT
jgi:hypothetical protein